MLFHFQLAPVADIAPWTDSRGEDKHLHWFGLTDGCYWLDVGDTELFRYNDALVEHWAQEYPEEMQARGVMCRHHVDYQVVRLWEDVLDMLPAVLEPVPEDLAAYLRPGGLWENWAAYERWSEKAHSWMDSAEDDLKELFGQAASWYWAIRLDSGHLRAGPVIWLWREVEHIHIQWDNRESLMDGIPAWSSPFGKSSLSVADFVDEVRSFDARLIGAMAERVDAVRHDWPHPDISLDWEGLGQDHHQRSGWFASALAHSPRRTDWDAVRAALAEMEWRSAQIET